MIVILPSQKSSHDTCAAGTHCLSGGLTLQLVAQSPPSLYSIHLPLFNFCSSVLSQLWLQIQMSLLSPSNRPCLFPFCKELGFGLESPTRVSNGFPCPAWSLSPPKPFFDKWCQNESLWSSKILGHILSVSLQQLFHVLCVISFYNFIAQQTLIQIIPKTHCMLTACQALDILTCCILPTNTSMEWF